MSKGNYKWDLLVSTGKGVLRYEAGTGDFKGAFASGKGVGTPTGLRFGPDGNLYVGNVGPDNVLRFNGKTGELIGIAASHKDLKHPRQVAFHGKKLLVSSRGASKVLSFDLKTGEYLETFSKVHDSYTAEGINCDGLNQPFGLIFDPGGNLLVASYGTDSVRRYDARTGVFIDTFACGHGLVQPRNIVYGPDGNLYVTSGNHRVLRFDGKRGTFIDAFVAPGSGGLHDPYGLEFGDDGNLYVISGGTNSALRYDGVTGAFLNIFVTRGLGGMVSASYAAFHGGLGGAFAPNRWKEVLK
jgi:streptogramin lyase